MPPFRGGPRVWFMWDWNPPITTHNLASRVEIKARELYGGNGFSLGDIQRKIEELTACGSSLVPEIAVRVAGTRQKDKLLALFRWLLPRGNYRRRLKWPPRAGRGTSNFRRTRAEDVIPCYPRTCRASQRADPQCCLLYTSPSPRD